MIYIGEGGGSLQEETSTGYKLSLELPQTLSKQGTLNHLVASTNPLMSHRGYYRENFHCFFPSGGF